ncbi:MAG TPA: NAD-dependent succinate-semialdehyde dehydrogenase [Longimicrobiales bacterium]|nr:NAD-dependent succinate-semialdehyde dehydrogenase [Longimicrobiales bacterium]
MKIESINPATGEVIESHEAITARQLGTRIRASERAYREWRETSFDERASLMRRAGELLRERAPELGRLMALEMGKPVAAGRAEADKCAWVCDYYADNAEQFLEPEYVGTDASRSYVAFRPIGPVLAVMPWNFPFWQVFRFAAPALMAGNVGLLKHASNVPGCALAIERIFRDAGFPDDTFIALLIETKHTKNAIRNPRVAAVTLTGSTGAGRVVAKTAGDRLKKSVLELGGSDPYMILEDADLERAVESCVTSRLINSGQSCIAAKRFIVVEPVREEFTRRFVERMRMAKVGDPLTEGNDLGPLARHDLRDELHDQVRASVDAGADCLLGGDIPDGPGAYYPPTVLANVQKGSPAWDDEMFGPVASIIPAEDEKMAVAIANDSVFGLGAAVFTRDVERGERIARDDLEAGCCFVNAFVKSDPRLPFGGIKESGFGRELSHYGIREFVNIKTVYVA